MKVYRLEKPIEVGGRMRLLGPWIAACYQKDLEPVTWRYKHTLPGPCPEPHEDDIKGFVENSEQICGWYNDRGIVSWCRWKDVTEALQAVGFTISVYDVPHDKVLLGRTQCVWWRKDGVLVGTVNWNEMVDAIRASEGKRLRRA